MTMKAKRRARRRTKHKAAVPAPMTKLIARAAPDPELQQRDLTVRTVPVRPSTLDEKARTVEATLATQARVTVFDFKTWRLLEEILLMRGVETPEQMPLLDSHRRYSINDQLGSIRQMRTEAEVLVGRLHFSSDDDGQRAWTKVAEGHVRDVSIGYRVSNGVTIEPGKSDEVEGVRYTASPNLPLRIALRWKPGEGSLTPIGADGAAGIRTDTPPPGTGRAAPSSTEDSAMTFAQWLAERSLKPEDLSEAQRAALTKDFEAARAAADPPADPPATPPVAADPPADPPATPPDDGQRAAIAAAGTTIHTLTAEQVQAATREAIAAVDAERAAVHAQIRAAGEGMPPELVETAVREDTTLDAAQTRFLKHVRESRTAVGPAIHVAPTATREIIEAGLLIRGGYPGDGLVERYSEETANRADRFRDVSLVDVCRMCATMDGIDFGPGRSDAIRAAFSSGTLPKVLGSVVHASLMRGYTLVEGSWRKFCTIGTLTDFKTATRIRVTDKDDLELVNNAGEIPMGSIEEEYEEIALATKGKMFVCTRQNIIDDNVSVLTKTPERLGRRANNHITNLVYTHVMGNPTLSDSIALFHASHSNLNTGCALSGANLGVALTALRTQTDLDGEAIDIGRVILIAPVALDGTARGILNSNIIVLSGSTDVDKGNANVWQGSAELVTDPRLSNSSYTGYSATSWYLAGHPADGDTIEVAFLNGKQTPTVEQVALAGNVLGAGWRVFLDVGVQAIDWRRLAKCTA